MSDPGLTVKAEGVKPEVSKPTPFSPNTMIAGEKLRVGVLNNPLSGGNRRGLGRIKEVMAAYQAVPNREVQTPADVASALDDFSRQEVNLIVINGGDGTVQAALTVLHQHQPFETLPLLAVLKAGTTSMTAGDVGLKGSGEQALGKVLQWARTGDGKFAILQRPVLRVEVAPGHEPVYGMFFGAAGIYQGIQFFKNRLNRRGFRGEWAPGLTIALFLLAVALRGRDYVVPVPVTTELDQGPPEQRNWLLVMISALERLFLGLRPYWGREQGPLHYTAVAAGPQHLLRVLPGLVRGKECRYSTPENGYFSHNVQQVRLTLNSGFTVDGELYEPDASLGPVVVQNGGQASFLRM